MFDIHVYVIEPFIGKSLYYLIYYIFSVVVNSKFHLLYVVFFASSDTITSVSFMGGITHVGPVRSGSIIWVYTTFHMLSGNRSIMSWWRMVPRDMQHKV